MRAVQPLSDKIISKKPNLASVTSYSNNLALHHYTGIGKFTLAGQTVDARLEPHRLGVPLHKLITNEPLRSTGSSPAGYEQQPP